MFQQHIGVHNLSFFYKKMKDCVLNRYELAFIRGFDHMFVGCRTNNVGFYVSKI